MRGAISILASAWTLSGCGPAGPEPDRSASAQKVRVPIEDSIAGRWVVVALDDEIALVGAGPITVTIDADTIRAQSQCVPFPFLYKRHGDSILLGKINPGGICARGLSHWEQEFDIGMYNADRVARTADGALVFSGTGGTVTMRADVPASRRTDADRPIEKKRSVSGPPLRVG